MKKFALILVLGLVLAACGGNDGTGGGQGDDASARTQACIGRTCDASKEYCLVTQLGHYDGATKKLSYTNRASQCVAYAGVRNCTALWADAKQRFRSSCGGDNFTNECQHRDSSDDGLFDVVTCTQIR